MTATTPTTMPPTPTVPRHDRTTTLWKSLSYSSVGIEMALAICMGFGFGYWLDNKFGTYPSLSLTFLIIGVAAAFRGLIRAGQQLKKDARSQSAELPVPSVQPAIQPPRQ